MKQQLTYLAYSYIDGARVDLLPLSSCTDRALRIVEYSRHSREFKVSPLIQESAEEEDYDDRLDDDGDLPGCQVSCWDRLSRVEMWWHSCSEGLRLVVVDLLVLLGVRTATDIRRTFVRDSVLSRWLSGR